MWYQGETAFGWTFQYSSSRNQWNERQERGSLQHANRLDSLSRCLAAKNDNDECDCENQEYLQDIVDRSPRQPQLSETTSKSLSRRNFLLSSAAQVSIAATSCSLLVRPAISHARGLVQFPCIDAETGANTLMNTYHLMRAGTSLLEEQDIWSTNPLFLTNRDDALSPLGFEQVRAAADRIIQFSPQRTPTIVKYSLAASCMDTANLLGQEFTLGRDRLIPEYTFLDPRAVGRWDMSRRSQTQPAVWAMDADAAGPDGMDPASRPPANNDGTPHEVLADQAVRLRQLLSLLESQDSGETIVLVFPDGTGPALLSCMIAGIPLNRVHELELLQPGDVRLNVTYHTTRQLWQERLNDDAFMKDYQNILTQGRRNIQQFKSATVETMNIRDQQLEQERISVEQQAADIQRARQAAEKEEDERRRRERQEKLVEAAAARSKEKQQPPGARQNPIVAAFSNMDVSTKVLGSAAFLTALGGAISSVREELGETNTFTEESNEDKGEALAANGDESNNYSNSIRPDGLYEDSPVNIPSTPPDSLMTIPQTVNGDRKNISPSVTMDDINIDPFMRAQKAMEDYLNQDDGGEAWIDSLEEILHDDDDLLT